MSVAVYPRLSAILEERRLSVDDLGRQIAELYGITVDPRTLQELMQEAPMERADLAAAGAAAAVLGIGLDDLFSVQAWPVLLDLPEPEPLLSPEKSRRLEDLFDRQDDGTITNAETAEVEALVAEHGHLLHERNVHEYAQRHNISEEEARQYIKATFEQALERWRALEADPRQRRALIASAKRRRSAKALSPSR
jgi:hypothetical protein